MVLPTLQADLLGLGRAAVSFLDHAEGSQGELSGSLPASWSTWERMKFL